MRIDPSVRPAGAPRRVSSFVGRSEELTELSARLADTRLLTVTGPGGVGKTSLVAQLLGDAETAGGRPVCWAGLGATADPDRVPHLVLAAVGIGDARGQDPVERLTGWLGERRLLLVLDNCEHLAGATAKLAATAVAACPGLSVLATSREPLGLSDEQIYRLGSLGLPKPDAVGVSDVLATEAGQLFVDRARAALPGYCLGAQDAAVVAAICHRLDGLPLALELAAARVRSMPVAVILDGLDQRFRLLTGGNADALPHQQTLAASVVWSLALLTEPEAVVLRRLAAFAGAFTPAAARELVADEQISESEVPLLVADLVERSLVDFDGVRYRLHQTVREFARFALAAAGETEPVRARHVGIYSRLAAATGRELCNAPRESVLHVVNAAYDDVMAALGELLAAGAQEQALTMVGDLTIYWLVTGHYTEALTWSRSVLAAAPVEPTAGRRAALWCVGQIGMFAMDLPGGWGAAQNAEAIETAAIAGDGVVLGRALVLRQFLVSFGDPAGAATGMSEALAAAQQAADSFGLLSAHACAALVWIFGCDRVADAQPHLDALAEAAARTGSAYWACWHRLSTGLAQWRAGSLAAALATLSEGWELASRLGDPMLDSWCGRWLCDVLVALDDAEAMEAVLSVAVPRQDASAIARREMLLLARAELAVRRGDTAAAAAVLDDVGPAVRELGIPFAVVNFELLAARVALLREDRAAAAAAVASARGPLEVLGTPWFSVGVDLVAGRVAHAGDDFGAAEDAWQRGLACAARQGFAGQAADLLEELAGVAVETDSHREAARLFAAADALRTDTGALRAPADQPRHDALLARASTALGAAQWGTAWAEGAELDLARAAAYAARARGERRRPASGWAALTPTETAVVEAIAVGRTNAQIAAELFITTATVKTHVHHVFTKLGLTNRTQLAAAALRKSAARAPDPGPTPH